MKKILVIGSAVVDVIIHLEDHLPVTGEDVHVVSQQMRLGGCAYNTSDILRHFGIPYIPFFPVGSGAYGDFVFSEFEKRSICSPIPRPEEWNGCCYCFIEHGGERTFISYHGAEYRFRKEWFDLLDIQDVESIFFCGLEIEEPTGNNVLDFLEQHRSIPMFFSPGPRLHKIPSEKMQRIFALGPILHLNRDEALSLSGCSTIEEAALVLSKKTRRQVLITLGREGCYYRDGDSVGLVPGVPARQVDTIGAGDSHIGALIAALHQGQTLPEAIRTANHIAAAVVETDGALLDDETFRQVLTALPLS